MPLLTPATAWPLLCAPRGVPPPQVRRFIKFNLGEGLEKRSNDFAAEVAEQTQKKEAAPKKEEPKVEEKKEEVSVAHRAQLATRGTAGTW